MDYNYKKFKVKGGGKVHLNDFSTNESAGFDKKSAKDEIKKNIKELREFQEMFYADDRYSLLIILQARDAAGKDGVIRHVMSGINPQGCRVHSFKTPTKIELEHDYMWRHYLALPERGMIEIFNRSHYENVLATRVHPEYILNERIPEIDSVDKIDKKFWANRYEAINAIEKHWSENGMRIVKIFLHISKEEQKKRFLARIDDPDKNWKFSSADLVARNEWDKYDEAYEEMLEKTSTDYAPWYIVPADKKYFARIAVGDIILEEFRKMQLRFPPAESSEMLAQARAQLENE
ncbi:MAG: polyphosphate kinase 2 family protein [Bacteroidales bacterium]|uniref:polyphosphate kinase 2 family protein n=1 Tax=Porphyromonas sp. TaxID=1924944 RepID=UPI002972BE18|nr:polyphosphate kinase 2 family protein [Porphyromonas sp.]MDD7438499.1 polyphosphate kinase 2 family protein [Bacteroidales bacterium]MDY3067082.1 polyphosphate kinase 2 family protein [Porphyromonas sp.]